MGNASGEQHGRAGVYETPAEGAGSDIEPIEEFEDGDPFTTASGTTTPLDTVRFCSLTGDLDQSHPNERVALDPHVRERVFAGPLSSLPPSGWSAGPPCSRGR
jgi:acyl dehydratase